MLISRFHPHVGGTESQALRLSKELVRQGVAVQVLTHRHSFSHPTYERIGGVEVVRVGWPVGSFIGSFSYLFHGLYWIWRQNPKPDIFHAHMLAVPAVLACLARQLFGVKVIVKIACSGSLGDIASAKRDAVGRAKLAYVRRVASTFISLSKEVQTELVSEGIPLEKIASIPNGVDTEEFHALIDASEKVSVQQSLGLSPARWIMFSGRLTAQKKPIPILRAFSAIAEEFPDARLIYIGEGDQAPQLKKAISESPYQNRVVVKSVASDVQRYYEASDIFLLPSEAEGMSNSLLEAMACGLVCVTTPVGANIELIENHGNGLLVDSSDLAKGLREALANPAEGRQLGEAARETVRSRYELRQVASRYRDLYRELQSSKN